MELKLEACFIIYSLRLKIRISFVISQLKSVTVKPQFAFEEIDTLAKHYTMNFTIERTLGGEPNIRNLTKGSKLSMTFLSLIQEKPKSRNIQVSIRGFKHLSVVLNLPDSLGLGSEASLCLVSYGVDYTSGSKENKLFSPDSILTVGKSTKNNKRYFKANHLHKRKQRCDESFLNFLANESLKWYCQVRIDVFVESTGQRTLQTLVGKSRNNMISSDQWLLKLENTVDVTSVFVTSFFQNKK